MSQACPLISNQVVTDAHQPFVQECLKKECAWWSITKYIQDGIQLIGMCSIKAIADRSQNND